MVVVVVAFTAKVGTANRQHTISTADSANGMVRIEGRVGGWVGIVLDGFALRAAYIGNRDCSQADTRSYQYGYGCNS